MIWGRLTSKGIGHVCKTNGTVDQSLYKSILEDDPLQTIDWCNLDAMKVIFQQDNDNVKSISSG